MEMNRDLEFADGDNGFIYLVDRKDNLVVAYALEIRKNEFEWLFRHNRESITGISDSMEIAKQEVLDRVIFWKH